MARYILAGGLMAMVGLAMAGCPQVSSSDATVDEVANAAAVVADQIGGTNGYGGTMMSGFMQGMPMHMGFTDPTKLAEPGATMTVRLHNDSNQQADFHLMYMSSPEGLAMQTKTVTVAASSQQDVELPCSEMVGAGALDQVGSVGCIMAGGSSISNRMAVPGFLGMDYECGGMFEFFLGPDAQDLNGNGDTTELILTSSSLRTHGTGGGMMGGNGMMGTGTGQTAR